MWIQRGPLRSAWFDHQPFSYHLSSHSGKIWFILISSFSNLHTVLVDDMKILKLTRFISQYGTWKELYVLTETSFHSLKSNRLQCSWYIKSHWTREAVGASVRTVMCDLICHLSPVRGELCVKIDLDTCPSPFCRIMLFPSVTPVWACWRIPMEAS